MSMLFGGPPSLPKPQPIPRPPTIDDAAQAADAADQLRKRKGYGATVLTGPSGAFTPTTNVGTKTLLGT